MKLNVQTHFSQGWNIKLLDKAKELGVDDIRDSQPWAKIETQKGSYVFPTQLVNYMDAAEAKGMSSLLTFASANALYDSGLTPHTAEGRAAYAQHILAVLRQYGSQVEEIEVWNEFNTGNFKGPAAQDDARYYTELLKVVYETVKPEFPEVKILGGSVNVVGTGALEDIFELGALRYMDGVSIHPYRREAEHVDDEIQHLRDVMAGHGEVKPIYATEFGREFTDPAEVPAFMLKMATLMASVDVKESYWYALIDQSHFENMGLLTRSGEEKPAAATFEFLKKELLPLGNPVRVDTGDDLTLVYRYGQDTYVMWGAARGVDFGAGRFFDARGNEIARPTALSAEPVVFKGEGFALGEKTVIADTLMEFGEGDWQYFAQDRNGKLTELSLVDWDWTSYYGSQYTKPLRVNADSIAPAGNGANPVRVVERYVSDDDQVVGVDAFWRTGVGDGVDLRIALNGVDIFSKSFTGLFELEGFKVTLRAGDRLDFSLGPNQTVEGDSTLRQITLTRISDQPVQKVPPVVAGIERTAHAGGELLQGTASADRLIGQGGDDRLLGGAGDDTLSGGEGRNLLDGGEGFDTVSYADASGAVDVRLGNTLPQTVSVGTQDRLVGIEAVIGSRFDDRFSGTDRDEHFFGGDGDDLFHASRGSDLVDGGAGRDTLSFQAFASGVSADLSTEARQEVAAGTSLRIVSIEALTGSEHADTLRAGDSGSTILALRGDDLVIGGAGNDTLDGGAGSNTISYETAASGVVVTLGLEGPQDTRGAGVDTIRRFQGLVGSSHDDFLTGSKDADRISGGAGADVIIGGAGADTLAGGAGADTFVYLSVSDSRPKAMDLILDFSAAEGDRISLSAIDANSRTAGNDAFTLVTAFDCHPDQLLVEARGAEYLVSGDVNGDGVADFALRVVSSAPLTEAAFIL
ncbi:M10 family metallopeptidase C-terminal domain-containing protein [Aureimonas phyllosphaerae]|uniref:M10 family metallopeptidase C-terminal domain-containing protein n=1 Tax=Aureimonas phyllosphaerae TaxID=1166078 RepID=UPI003A5C72CE